MARTNVIENNYLIYQQAKKETETVAALAACDTQSYMQTWFLDGEGRPYSPSKHGAVLDEPIESNTGTANIKLTTACVDKARP